MSIKSLEALKLKAKKQLGKKIVFSDGDPKSPIMFIGEAPGRFEEEQGKPFVGAAGKNLDRALESARISRGSVYITNIVLWRPPNNRKPVKSEVDICKPYLLGQIKIIRPKIIVSLGNTPLEFFTGKKSISKFRGKLLEKNLEGMRLRIFPTFHPAAILYNRKLKNVFEKDIRKAVSLAK